MPNRFPLIINATSQQIQELASGDNLDLSGNDISNVGNITVAFTSTLGSISNVKITGGTSGQLIITDGAGNLSFTSSVPSATTATTAGTVTTAAQPNITSTGTLTSLAVSGTGNIDTITLNRFTETVSSSFNTGTILNPSIISGSIQRFTANSNFTFNGLSNGLNVVPAGASMTVIITQDATGSRLLTSTMKFAGGSKTLSTTAGSIDIISVFYDGTTYYASLVKGFA